MKNKQVIDEFLSDGDGKTKNLYFEKINGKMVLFSYGRHFPLCVKLNDGFLFNVEGYSVTTARHKGLLARGLNFSSFKELEKTHINDLMTSSQLNRVIESDALSKAEIIANKI
jgi:hypothetical protein